MGLLDALPAPGISFDPLIEQWFMATFPHPTEPQIAGWPVIASGRDTLICAPTGSGKTLAAFLIALDRLVRIARHAPADAVTVLYVSPLKALVNDVQRNLDVPLAGIQALAAQQGIPLAPIRVALRTGDSTSRERERMLAARPHILVTTPESLSILLTAARSRELLQSISTVICDEIHAVVESKRGPHLALSLARLDELVRRAGRPRPQRIGLSATVQPIDAVARFLVPAGVQPKIVDIGHRRDIDLSVWVPPDELRPVVSSELWQDIYDHMAEIIRDHRTTLVFVSTRRLAERVAHNLRQRLGEGAVMPHHGSLARHLRMDTERALKEGRLRAVVATASLELGIDIGTVDVVMQLGSPRSIAVAWQRIGRSGHWVGAKPKGIFVPTTRDDLVECAALVRALRRGAMDSLNPCRAPLDILAQQIVAACACDDWDEDELFALVRSTDPYASLPRTAFDAVVGMLSDGVATARGRAGALLHRDRVHRRLRGRRGARLAAITGGGAIPDTTTYAVVAEPEGTVIGTLDEDFAVESMSGDIFLLGTHSWRVRRVEQGRVRVEDAAGAPPSIPFWNGEGRGRTRELSQEVSELRLEVARRCESGGRDHARAYLESECGLDRLGAEQIVDYVMAGRSVLGAVPGTACVIAERFFDESGGMQLVIHAPFGARINRAWGLALRKRFCRSFNLELQAAATDNGIVISLSEQHAFPLEIIFDFLKTHTVEEVLTQALLPSPMFTARWRWNAQRSLTILRFRGGRRLAAPLARMKADDLLAAVFPDQAACPENLSGDVRIPDHPLVNETIANCLHEAMDLAGLQDILRGIERGTVRTLAVETPEPSVFSHEILNANPFAFLDDAPLEERRARAVALRSTLRTKGFEGGGIVDQTAIAEVASDVWPVVRDAEELHDALLTLVALPPVPQWQNWFAELTKQGRATLLDVPGTGQPIRLWVAAERLQALLALHTGAVIVPTITAPPWDRVAPDAPEQAMTELARGWLECSGPLTASWLARTFGVSEDLATAALVRLEGEGQVLRGHFLDPAAHCHADQTDHQASPAVDAVREILAGEVQWCNRRVLARIHRLTLGRLRREIEPVTTVQYEEFLARWQHRTPTTRLHGLDGTLQVIKQLQGMEFPAEAWEREVLPARVARYRPEYLDRLCAAGEVMWGRLSPHPALEARPAGGIKRRVRPTRVAPVALFLRDDASWLVPERTERPAGLSPAAREVAEALKALGASFFIDLVRATGRLASEVEDGLWELVAAGMVTADSFDNLRALIDPKRRLGLGRHNRARPRHALGRWALVRAAARAPEPEASARLLLQRWGVVFRDVAKRETCLPPWRDLLVTLRRLEAQGEIRGGRFVAAFVGEQFALPEALALLRAVRRESFNVAAIAQ